LSRHGWGREEEEAPFEEDPDDAQVVRCAASMEIVERLCALVSQPRANTILYHGVLAAHSKLRGEVVPVKPPHRRQAEQGIKLIVESQASASSRDGPGPPCC